MRVGHSDNSLPQFQWTNQALWKSTTTTTTTNNNNINNNNHNAATEASHQSPSTVVTQSSLLPCSRIQHASCVLGRHLYLFGGKDRYMPLKDMWRFNLDTGRWEPMVFAAKESRMPHLQGHSMAAYRSQVFIFGGSFGESPDDTPLWIYSPDLNHARKYTGEPLHPCPLGRREHTAVVYKNSMYIFGGFLNSSGSTDDLWAFNLEEEEWSRLPCLKDGKRHGHVSVVHGQSMWVHGGVRGFDSLSDFWMYKFELLMWTKVKASGRSPCLSHHTAHVINDSIVVVGGARKSTPASGVWLYGIGSNTWRQVDVEQSQLFAPVFFHTSVLIHLQSDSNSAKDKSSQSTPHLKSHHTETLTPSVRPWTSPGPKNDPPPTSSHSPSVNVLTIHSSHNNASLTDKNNNSEENLFSCSESCFKSSHPEAIEMTDFDNFHHDKNINGSCQKSPIQSSPRENNEKLRIRPASLEHCHDDLPLLERRFCSVDSSIDLGENNAVISISDEGLNNQPSSNMTGPRIGQINFQYDNPAFLPVISSPTHSTTVDSMNIASYHKTNIDCHYKNDTFSLVNSQLITLTDPIDYGFPKSGSKYIISENHDPVNSFTKESSVLLNNSLAKPAKDEKSCEEDSFCELPTNQSLDDLVLEDLESCENENCTPAVSVRLASSSKQLLRVKSSSLKDVSSLDHQTSHPFCINSPRKTRSNSFSSLTVLFNESVSHSNSLSSSTVENESGNMSIDKSTTVTERSGKYIKRPTNNCSHRNGFWMDKRRSSFHSSLQKMAQKSISTQTSASLSSLTSNTKLTKTTVEEKSQIMNCSPSDDFLPLVSESKDKSDDQSGLSHLSDCKYILLVLGGQMETPTFTKTPISIWKCKIF